MKANSFQIDKLREALRKDDAILSHAIVHLYQHQTDSEKVIGTANTDNGVGFNGTDAAFGGEMAKTVMKYGSLKGKQIVWCREKIMKYAGQLINTGFVWENIITPDKKIVVSAFDEQMEEMSKITQKLLGVDAVELLEVTYQGIRAAYSLLCSQMDVSDEWMQNLERKLEDLLKEKGLMFTIGWYQIEFNSKIQEFEVRKYPNKEILFHHSVGKECYDWCMKQTKEFDENNTEHTNQIQKP